jgi:hypothetical protein
VVEEFCGCKLDWREDNRAEGKWYGRLYAEFLDRYVVGADELRAIYSSRYATFFFSDDTRAALEQRWQNTTLEFVVLHRDGQSAGS